MQEADRMRYYMVNVRHDRIMYGMASASLQSMGASRNPSDVRLELGKHSIAQELRRLGLGRMIDYHYGPEGQLILNSVLESYDLSRP